MHCVLFSMLLQHKYRWRLKIMRHHPIKARLFWKAIAICYSYLVAASHTFPSPSISVFKRRKLCKPKICNVYRKQLYNAGSM